MCVCSVTELAGILRQAVEDEDPLSPELRIPGKTFYIDGVGLNHSSAISTSMYMNVLYSQ